MRQCHNEAIIRGDIVIYICHSEETSWGGMRRGGMFRSREHALEMKRSWEGQIQLLLLLFPSKCMPMVGEMYILGRGLPTQQHPFEEELELLKSYRRLPCA